MLSGPSAWRLFWRALAVAISALAVLRVGVGVTAWRAAEGLERPKYEVIRKVGRGIEIRCVKQCCCCAVQALSELQRATRCTTSVSTTSP
jgi:hypothetical protein